jgi:FAD:protein FMN transferase
MLRLLPVSAAFLVALASCDRSPDVIQLSGETMGTTYHVTVVDPPSEVSVAGLQDAVEVALANVNHQMSNWDPNSEVSLFNASTSTEPVEISASLADLLQTAEAIHVLSGGMYDVTVAPLVELWGFGKRQPGEPIPSNSEIDSALEVVGQGRLIELLPGPRLAKLRPEVTINLSSIAKGYGIDRVADTLREAGVERYLVEIGGDLVTAGENPSGQSWAIGIEKPEPDARVVELAVNVTDLGMATSGDYRNFFEKDGVRYSHIIDPTTGRPITHHTTSVTVVAKNAMRADGLATALLAMGESSGMDVAEENNIAAMFISREEDKLVTRTTSAFEKIATFD